MKKFFVSITLSIAIATPAFAHFSKKNPAHLNPHWLPILFVVATVVVLGWILYKLGKLKDK